MTTPQTPPGALVLLVGPAGAGKSTYAAHRYLPTEILSSDAFRALVADDPADQEANADAFRLLHAVARARSRRGLTTVVDATNLTDGARRPLLALAERFGRPVVAIIFDGPVERALAQNAARSERVVPEAVVRLHHAQLAAAVAALRRGGIPMIAADLGKGIEGLHDGGLPGGGHRSDATDRPFDGG